MRCVLRRRAFALSWILGTSAGVLLGLFGVQLVTSGITGSRINPLSRPEVLQALSAGDEDETPEATAPSPATTDNGPATPLPGPVSKPAPTPPASAPPRPGATAGPTVTTGASPATAPPVTAPPAPPATSAPPATTPPATGGRPGPAAPPDRGKPGDSTTGAPSEQRTISSRGGRVAVQYQGGEVRLLWARPDDGYDVMVVDDGPQRVHVRFRSKEAWSRVLAFYDRDGRPAEEVNEGRRENGRGNEDSAT